jgi:pyruvyltransferase
MMNLKYVKSTPERPYANFGDALSPIIVSMLTGKEVVHQNFDSSVSSLVAVGTILQDIRNGRNDIWGTGIDCTAATGGSNLWIAPKNTEFNVFATRGLITAQVLRGQGIECPDLFGDPAQILSLNADFCDIPRNGLLGVIPHFYDFDSFDPFAIPTFPPLKIRHGRGFRVISPLTEPNVISVLKKVREILSFSVILTSSFHAYVLAQTFGIPCAFLTWSMKSGRYSIFDYRPNVFVDHRLVDWYSGMDLSSLFLVGLTDEYAFDAEETQRIILDNWCPIRERIKINAIDLIAALESALEQTLTVGRAADNLDL